MLFSKLKQELQHTISLGAGRW